MSGIVYPINEMRAAFGRSLKENIPLSGFTTARVGGNADLLFTAKSRDDLIKAVSFCWENRIPVHILGAGSNILVSDSGLRGAVIINRARLIKMDCQSDTPTLWAESGANLSSLVRQTKTCGLGGLEWASSIPGTLGGAVYGNAGAHGGDMRGNLILADILHPVKGLQEWSCEMLEYTYRSSSLKQADQKAVILSATLRLNKSDSAAVKANIDEFANHRRRTQPPGASMGSMFKNPPGDYAGRLIEAAGLKGTRIGGAEISSVHANFFVNDEQATAADIWRLIQRVQNTVLDKFGIQLQLEVELLGEWPAILTQQAVTGVY